jgi:hypothetical protein
MATSVAAGKLATAAAAYPPLNQRPVKGTVLLFDVDETLTKSRQVCLRPASSTRLDKIPAFEHLLRSLLPKSQP